MYVLREIRLYNFKTYAGEYVLGPLPGFTAVIGPNASGKSNIVDAVLFACCAASARLSGPELVIFRGLLQQAGGAGPGPSPAGRDGAGPRPRSSQGRAGGAARGVEASVTLTFSPRAAEAPAPPGAGPGGDLEFRRALNGAGEYSHYVNGAEVTQAHYLARLRGTGLLLDAPGARGGPESRQGAPPFAITQHMAAGPFSAEEMTFLVDAASGSRAFAEAYESHQARLEALKARNKELLDEVNSLRRRQRVAEAQSTEAASYAELQEEIRGISVASVLLRLCFFGRDISTLRRALRGLEDRAAELDARAAEAASSGSQARDRQRALGLELQRRQKAVREASARLDESLRPEASRLSAAQALLQKRLSVAQGAFRRMSEGSRASDAELRDLELRISAQEAAAAEVVELMSRARATTLPAAYYERLRALEASHADLFEAVRQAASGRERAQEALQRAQQRAETARASAAAQERQRRAAEEDRDHADSRVRRYEASLAEQEERMRTLREELISLGTEKQKLLQRHRELSVFLSASEAGNQDIQRQKKLRATLAMLRARFPGVLGTFGDLTSVLDRRDAPAVELATSGYRDLVVCDTFDTVRKAIAELRQQRLPPLSFFSEDVAARKAGGRDTLQADREAAAAYCGERRGQIVPLCDALSYDREKVGNVVQLLCRNSFVSTQAGDDQSFAQGFAWGGEARHKVFTRTGLAFQASGVIQCDLDTDRAGPRSEETSATRISSAVAEMGAIQQRLPELDGKLSLLRNEASLLEGSRLPEARELLERAKAVVSRYQLTVLQKVEAERAERRAVEATEAEEREAAAAVREASRRLREAEGALEEEKARGLQDLRPELERIFAQKVGESLASLDQFGGRGGSPQSQAQSQAWPQSQAQSQQQGSQSQTLPAASNFSFAALEALDSYEQRALQAKHDELVAELIRLKDRRKVIQAGQYEKSAARAETSIAAIQAELEATAAKISSVAKQTEQTVADLREARAALATCQEEYDSCGASCAQESAQAEALARSRDGVSTGMSAFRRKLEFLERERALVLERVKVECLDLPVEGEGEGEGSRDSGSGASSGGDSDSQSESEPEGAGRGAARAAPRGPRMKGAGRPPPARRAGGGAGNATGNEAGKEAGTPEDSRAKLRDAVAQALASLRSSSGFEAIDALLQDARLDYSGVDVVVKRVERQVRAAREARGQGGAAGAGAASAGTGSAGAATGIAGGTTGPAAAAASTTASTAASPAPTSLADVDLYSGSRSLEAALAQLSAQLGIKQGQLAALEPNLRVAEELEDITKRLETRRRELAETRRTIAAVHKDCEAVHQERASAFLKFFERFSKAASEAYRGLTGGYGGADAVLSNPQTPWAPGAVDFNVIPPTNQLRSVGSLSGGERSVAMLAFVLAALQTAGCPFILLDEFDSSLDSGAITAVARYLAHQPAVGVLAVSHKSGFFSQADVLVGTTRPGEATEVYSLDLRPHARREE